MEKREITEENVLLNIKNILDSFEYIENVNNNIKEYQSENDLEISDLLHLMQNNNLEDKNLLKVSKRLKEKKS